MNLRRDHCQTYLHCGRFNAASPGFRAVGDRRCCGGDCCSVCVYFYAHTDTVVIAVVAVIVTRSVLPLLPPFFMDVRARIDSERHYGVRPQHTHTVKITFSTSSGVHYSDRCSLPEVNHAETLNSVRSAATACAHTHTLCVCVALCGLNSSTKIHKTRTYKTSLSRSL